MYLKNIQLINFGSYRGYNKLDLTTTKNKNVILFGGKNGAGKTTLLNAIKIGMFGAFSLRYRTENQEYLTYIDTLLNNEAKRLGENTFSVTLQFVIEEQFTELDYELKREWHFDDGQLKESYFLLENGKLLGTHEKEIFYDRLKEIMPPQLLDVALFDGEEISRIIVEDELAQYIEKLVSVVFNLELFEILEEDLDTYSKQQIDTDQANKIETILIDLVNEEQKLKSNFAINTNLLNTNIEELDLITEEYEALKRDFELHGGLDKNERDSLQEALSQLEANRKQRSMQIREFVSNLLPMFLMTQTLHDTRTQITEEAKAQFSQQFGEQFKLKDLELILNDLTKGGSIDSNALYSSIHNHLMPSNVEANSFIHNASFPDAAKIENAYKSTQKNLPQQFLTLLQKNAEDLKNTRDLRNKLRQHDETAEFKDTIKKIEEYQQKSILLEQNIQELEEVTKYNRLEIEQIGSKIEQQRKLLGDFSKTSNSLLTAQKIIAVSKRYREIQIYNKLQDVQIKAVQNLKTLLQKENYITSIQIDSKTFDVSLFDQNQNRLNKKSISAGEKQILLLSIIWAIFEVSHRTVPFLFDTLLGRLDQTHRISILDSFIPSFGKQTIVLSTDSEINEELYQSLVPHISKEYTLSFNTKSQKTNISTSYFDFKKEVD